MPSRRIPNSDNGRIKALKTALMKGQDLPPQKLAFTSKTYISLYKFIPRFEHSIQTYRQSFINQNKKRKDYNETFRKAKIYLTHFLKVMNMAIYRGDLPSETRAYYGLPVNDSATPSFNNESEFMSWGRRIIEGEELRISKGGCPITNPTIAVVKVRFENFIETLNSYAALVKKTRENMNKIIDLRNEGDEIIVQIWNEVEKTHSTLPETERKLRNEEYGLIYSSNKSGTGKEASLITQGHIYS
jgi:hypothetical protein